MAARQAMRSYLFYTRRTVVEVWVKMLKCLGINAYLRLFVTNM